MSAVRKDAGGRGKRDTSTPSKRRRRASDPFRYDKSLLAEYARCGRGRLDDGLLDEARSDLRLAGADEAGRGCLAGPLVAAAVVLDYGRAPFPLLKGLTDSKLLTLEAREAMYQGIMRSALRVTWVACSPETIDTVGLHRSNLAALRRALELLGDDYRIAIVDGFDLARSDLRAQAIIGADFKSAAVAAASVVAKVVRDRLMRRLASLHPGYGFEEHVGYATGRHREALLEIGPCVLHRRSFQGVGTQQLELTCE